MRLAQRRPHNCVGKGLSATLTESFHVFSQIIRQISGNYFSLLNPYLVIIILYHNSILIQWCRCEVWNLITTLSYLSVTNQTGIPNFGVLFA